MAEIAVVTEEGPVTWIPQAPDQSGGLDRDPEDARERLRRAIAGCWLERSLIRPFGFDSSYFLKCDSSFPFMVSFDECFDQGSR